MMPAVEVERYWRIRMRFEDESLEKDAWRKNEVGLWYGAWTAADLEAALLSPDPAKHLSNLPEQRQVGWPDPTITPAYFGTIRRFRKMEKADWVWVYYDGALHFAHPCEDLTDDPEFNRKREKFKVRSVTEKKSFRLSQLPNSFLLLPSAGRGNIHELDANGMRPLLAILAGSCDEEEARSRIEQLPLSGWLDILGPKAWEAICEGYLILQRGFVTTGLRIGGTLRWFDIVGRDRRGVRILAQCKKHPHPCPIDPTFLEGCEAFPAAEPIYFAYGGCDSDALPVRLKVITRKTIEQWLESDHVGKEYAKWLREGDRRE